MVVQKVPCVAQVVQEPCAVAGVRAKLVYGRQCRAAESGESEEGRSQNPVVVKEPAVCPVKSYVAGSVAWGR